MMLRHIHHGPILEGNMPCPVAIDWSYWFNHCDVISFPVEPEVPRILYLYLKLNDSVCGMVYAETLGLDGVE